jgi:hypothetical protein
MQRVSWWYLRANYKTRVEYVLIASTDPIFVQRVSRPTTVRCRACQFVPVQGKIADSHRTLGEQGLQVRSQALVDRAIRRPSTYQRRTPSKSKNEVAAHTVRIGRFQRLPAHLQGQGKQRWWCEGASGRRRLSIERFVARVRTNVGPGARQSKQRQCEEPDSSGSNQLSLHLLGTKRVGKCLPRLQARLPPNSPPF